MKKVLALAALLALFSIRPSFADTSSPSDQILASLLQHVVGITEFTTHGQTKLEFIDGIIQVGHYKGDYIFAVDAGFCNSTDPDAEGHLAKTAGVHVHVFSALNNYLNFNPALAQTLSLLELTPRWSYDTDVHKGVLGITFGARIPFN